MIGELQLLKQTLDMVEHLMPGSVRMLRRIDAHNLDLVELVQAVESAHVLTVAAGLTTETGGVGATLDRQVLLVENLVAEDVGHRYLSRRNEVEVVEVGMIHLALLVGQLTRAVARGGIDDIRRLNLNITGLAGLIEEEGLKGTLEAGHLTDVDGEAGTGNLHTEVEVDEVELLQQIPVAECVLRKVGHDAAFLDDDIAGGILALGHLVVGDIGDFEQLVDHVVLSLVINFLQGFVVGFQFGHLRLHLFCFLLLAFFHQTANLL